MKQRPSLSARRSLIVMAFLTLTLRAGAAPGLENATLTLASDNKPAKTDATQKKNLAKGPVDKDRRKAVVALPGHGEVAADRGRNLLVNSSFEVGGWGWNCWMEKTQNIQGTMHEIKDVEDYLHNGDCPSGRTCLKIPNKQGFLLESDFARVSPFKEHTLSFCARSEGEDGALPLKVEVLSGFPQREGVINKHEISQTFDLTANWKRYCIKGELGVEGSQRNGFSVRFTGLTPHAGFIFIDAVQLEQGSLTGYAPQHEVEVSGALIDWRRTTHLYFPGEKIHAEIKCWRTQRKQQRSLRLLVSDIFGKTVLAKTVPAVCREEPTGTVPFSFVLDRTGIFRLEITAMQAKSLVSNTGEVVFGVVPKPGNYGRVDEGSFAGFQGNDRDRSFKLTQIQKAGVKWFRVMDFVGYYGWNNIEADKGKYTWHDADTKALLDAGMSIMATQMRQPRWASSAPETEDNFYCHPPRDYSEYAEFVRANVRHHQGKIKYWEIGNEPFAETFWPASPEEYVRYVKTAYQAAKSVDANCKIVGGVNMYPTLSWLERAFSAGLLDYLDVLSYHDYSTPRSNEYLEAGYRIDKMRELMNRYGKDLPIWMSEGGMRSWGFFKEIYRPDDLKTSEPESDLSPLCAAGGLIKTYTEIMWHGVRKYFYYYNYTNAFYGGEYANNAGCGVWGSSAQGQMVERNGVPKPLLVAQAVYLHLLDKAEPAGSFVRKVDPEWNVQINLFLFEKDSKPVAVLWGDNTLDGYFRISLPLKDTQVRVLDLMGNEIRRGKQQGGWLRVSENPVYLVGVDTPVAAFRNAMSEAKVNGGVAPEILNMVEVFQSRKGIDWERGVRREPDTLDFYDWEYLRRIEAPDFGHAYLYRNIYSGELRVLLWVDGESSSVRLPGMKLEGVETIKSGDRVSFRIDDKNTEFRLDRTPVLLKGDFNAAGWEECFRRMTISTIKPFAISDARLTKEGYALFIKNLVGSNLALTITVDDVPGWLRLTEMRQTIVLPPHESGKLVFEITKDFYRELPGSVSDEKIRIRIDAGKFGGFEESHRIRLLKSVELAGSIQIDGELQPSEWSEASEIEIDNMDESAPCLYGVASPWNGFSDCSANVKAKWDRDNLYLAFRVTDDKLAQPYRGGHITLGDCVEILLSKNQTLHLGEKNLTTDDYWLSFAPIPDREGSCSVSAPSNGPAAWRKTPAGFNIEVAIPWKCLGDFDPMNERIVAFDVAVDDNDGEDRKYQMVWAGAASTSEQYFSRTGRRGALVLCKA